MTLSRWATKIGPEVPAMVKLCPLSRCGRPGPHGCRRDCCCCCCCHLVCQGVCSPQGHAALPWWKWEGCQKLPSHSMDSLASRTSSASCCKCCKCHNFALWVMFAFLVEASTNHSAGVGHQQHNHTRLAQLLTPCCCGLLPDGTVTHFHLTQGMSVHYHA